MAFGRAWLPCGKVDPSITAALEAGFGEFKRKENSAVRCAHPGCFAFVRPQTAPDEDFVCFNSETYACLIVYGDPTRLRRLIFCLLVSLG